MKNPEKSIVPVLLGADLNCYSVARAFYHAYGVVSYVFGRYALGATKYSRFLRFQAVEALDRDDVLLKTLLDFAHRHAGESLYLLGCTDAYAELIIRNKAALSPFYFCPCPDRTLAETLVSKRSFYRMCEEYGIAYPKTVVLERETPLDTLDLLPFPYPIILKPSSSIEYWKHPFSGMKKVYRAEDAASAKRIAAEIFASGYPDDIIVQDFIPGDDSGMYVLTAYSDQNAKVRMMALGHVLLEEHTPKGLGNHVAILTEYHAPIVQCLRDFLEKIGYTGFSNFDIKFDPRDGVFKVFEINLRQGRSNGYITAAGVNLASLPVRDAEHRFGEEVLLLQTPSFWHAVPKKIVYSYIRGTEAEARVRALVKSGACQSALFDATDLRANPLRLAYVLIHNRRYYKKYRQYP